MVLLVNVNNYKGCCRSIALNNHKEHKAISRNDLGDGQDRRARSIVFGKMETVKAPLLF